MAVFDSAVFGANACPEAAPSRHRLGRARGQAEWVPFKCRSLTVIWRWIKEKPSPRATVNAFPEEIRPRDLR